MLVNPFPTGRGQGYFLVFLVLATVGIVHPLSLQADIYKWIDRQGNSHFTDNPLYIPQEYRDDVQILKEKPRSKEKKPSGASPLSRRFIPAARWVRVAGVIDGDTIVLANGEKVRYLGIDTPETKKPKKLPDYCGQEAFAINRGLVLGEEVSLEFDVEQRDRYGRLLAYVFTRDLFVNAELIRRGYAQVSTYLPNVKYRDFFLELQRQAIAQDRGLWGGCKETTLAQPAGKIVGNKRSQVYHLPGGAFYDRVDEENRVYFDSIEQAERAGYRRAKR